MANNIDTATLTALISEFRNLQAKDSVTPESLGSILQRVSDLLSTAATADSQRSISNWFEALSSAAPYISDVSQNRYDLDDVLLDVAKVSTDSGQQQSPATTLTIKSATSDRAGAMTTQHVADLDALVNLYTDSVEPAIESLDTMRTGFGVVGSSEMDDIPDVDKLHGRLVGVRDSAGFSEGFLMHLVCRTSVTQVYFTHLKLGEDGDFITSSAAEKGFNIYKRSRDQSGSHTGWSAWKLVGGDEFAVVKRRVDSMLDLSDDEAALTARGNIAVAVVDDKLNVYGAEALAKAGYVPYLFRNTRKRNRDRNHSSSLSQVHGPVSKGWHLFGSRHSVRVVNSVASFSTNEKIHFHVEAGGYSTDPLYLVHPHTRDNGTVALPWGRAMIGLYDTIAGQNRMVRLRFAIGYGRPEDHGTTKINVDDLVSNLAEFSVVYDPKRNVFRLSR